MFCECSDILVRYGRTVVLDVKRLIIPAGQITAVVGPNGAGKTTLLEVISLLRAPTAGRISLWGKLAKPSDQQLRRKVVMVMHPGYMFRGDVWANLTYGLKARGIDSTEAQRRADSALKMVGLSDFAHRNARSLSAGERQRVNLARAIVIGPEAILLDEPVANVDAQTVELIRNLLCRLRDELGTTIIHTSPGNGQLQDIVDQVVPLAAGLTYPHS